MLPHLYRSCLLLADAVTKDLFCIKIMTFIPTLRQIRCRRIGLALSNTPVRILFRLYYWLSVRALVFLLRRNPHVIAVVLSGSAARGTMRYGISDIDFFVLIKSVEESERIRDDIEVTLVFLRRLFLPLANSDEVGILTIEEFESTLQITKPYLLAIANQLRPIFVRGDLPLISKTLSTLSSSLSPGAIRLAIMSDVWRKFLLYLEHLSFDETLARYVLQRITERLDEVVPLPTNVRGNAELMFSCFRNELLSTIETRGSMQNMHAVIPNRLFRETVPISIIRAFSEIPQSFEIRQLDFPSLAEIDELRRKKNTHYAYVGGVLLPLLSGDNYSILTVEQNPLTFAAICDDEVPGNGNTPLATVNRREAKRLADGTAFLFLNGPTTLLFALGEILYWLERDQARDSERLEQIADLQANGNNAEACFAAQSLLRGSERKQLRVSVLIPTFNRAASLRQTIDSLLIQSRQPEEILVIDNGSSDETVALLEEYVSSFSKFRWVCERTPGGVAARNCAIQNANSSSDVVLFIDDDCLAPKDWVQNMMLPFEYDSQVVSCGGGISFRDDDCTAWGDFYRQKYKVATAEVAR